MEDFFDDKTKEKAKKIIVNTSLSLIPWVGKIASASYELRELMKERAREIRDKEVEHKVNEFHEQLFRHTITVNENNQESFFQDYTKILENMLRDNEAEKTHYYANLLGFFSNQDIGKDDKVFLLSTLKSLSNFEVGILQKAIVSKRFHLTTNPLPRHSAILSPALKKIVQMGLFDQDGEDIAITKAGEFIANAIFLPGTLTPESIGCSIFRASRISLLCFYDLDCHSLLQIDYIVDLIKSKLHNGRFEIPSPAFISSRAKQIDDKPLILFSKNVILIHDKHFSPIKHRKQLERCNLIRIYIQTDETPDPLQDLQNANINSYAVKPEREIMQDMVNEIWNKHLSHLP